MKPTPWLALGVVPILAGVVAAQDPPALVAVVLRTDHPTSRALVQGLEAAHPSGTVGRGAAGDARGRDARLRAWDRRRGGALVALGGEVAAGVLEATERVPVVAVGPFSGWPERGLLAPPSDARRVVRVDLRAAPGALRRTFERFLPDVRRVGVVVRAEAAEGVPREGAGRPTLALVPEVGAEPRTLLARWAPQVGALVLPDDPALLDRAAGLTAAAAVHGLPVVTTAAWLARSGAALGVVPDEQLCVLRIGAAVRAALGARAPPARTVVPRRTVVALGPLLELGLRPGTAALLAADLVLPEGGR